MEPQPQEQPRKGHPRAARALGMTTSMILGAALMMLFFFMTTPTMELRARVGSVDENGLVTLDFASMYSGVVAGNLEEGNVIVIKGYVMAYSVQSGQSWLIPGIDNLLDDLRIGGENHG